MRKIQKQNRFNFAGGEHRLLALAGGPPKGVERMLSKEDVERMRPRWELVMKYLKIAAAKDWNIDPVTKDSRLETMLRDKDTLNMIASLVGIPKDSNSLDWLSEAVAKYAEAFEDEYQQSDEDRLRGLNDTSEKDVRGFMDKLRKSLEQINAEETEYEKATKPKKKLPLYEGKGNVKEIWEKRKDKDKEIRDRQAVLIGLADAILQAEPGSIDQSIADYVTTRGVAEINTILGKSNFAGQSADINGIINQFNAIGTTKHEELVSKMLDVLHGESGMLFSDKEVKKMESAKEQIDDRLKQLDKDQTKLIGKHSKERTAYLDQLGGMTMHELIGGSIDRDYILDFDVLEFRLLQRKVDPNFLNVLVAPNVLQHKAGLGAANQVPLEDEATEEFIETIRLRTGQLITDDIVKETIFTLFTKGVDKVDHKKLHLGNKKEVKGLVYDIMACWDQSQLIDYLKIEAEFEDIPAGMWLNRAFHSAHLPEDIVKFLEVGSGKHDKTEGLHGMYMQWLFESVSIKSLLKDPDTGEIKKDFDEKLAGDIIKACTKKHDEKRFRLDEEKFIHMMTFLFLEPGDELKQVRIARKKAQALLDIFEDTSKKLSALGPGKKDIIFERTDDAVILGKNGHDLMVKIMLGQSVDALVDASIKKAMFDNNLMTKAKPNMILGEQAREFLKNIRDGNLHNVSLWGSTKLVASEAYENVKFGGKVWWNWIKSIPGYYTNQDLDRGLGKIFKQRTALKRYKARIDDMLTMTRSTEKLKKQKGGVLNAIFADVKEHHKNRAKLRNGVDVGASPKEHIAQSQYLLKASYHVIETLSRTNLWKQRTLRKRQISLWIAMNMSLDKAREYLADPDAFTDAMAAKDRKALDTYLRKIDAFEEMSGYDNLTRMKRDLKLDKRPNALKALAAAGLTKGDTRITRWLRDRKNAVNPLHIALVVLPGGSPLIKASLIDAFVNNRDITVDVETDDGTMVPFTITKEYAYSIVSELQRNLLNQSQQRQLTNEQLEVEEFFENPLDKGLRAGLEAIGELWSGDWVDKSKVILGGLAGVYLIWQVMKRANDEDAPWWAVWGQRALIGLPLVMIVNSAAKKHTGRDYLGEFLFAQGKDKRNSAYSKHWREVANIDKFNFLWTEPGKQAEQELLGEGAPSVAELLDWREQVDANGYRDYELGAPPGLRVGDIMYHMGANPDRKEAFKYAFWAFEALCVGVAAEKLNLRSGTVESRVEAGADYIERHYVNLEDYNPHDPYFTAATHGLAGMHITMADVMHDVSPVSEIGKEMLENRTWLEYAGDVTGYGAAKFKNLAERTYLAAQVELMQLQDKAPEMWEKIKNFVTGGAAYAYDLVKTKGTLAYASLSDQAKAAWNLLYKTLLEAGVVAMEVTPGVIEWTLATGGSLTLGTAQAIYRQIDSMSLTGDPLRELERFLAYHTGGTIGGLLRLRAGIETDPEHLKALADRTRFKENFTKQVLSFSETFVNDTTLNKWIILTAENDLGITFNPNNAIPPAQKILQFDEFSAHDKMMVYEQLKRRVYARMIAARFAEVLGSGTKSVEKVNITDWDTTVLTPTDVLHQKIYESYGLRTLALLGMENTWQKDWQEYAESLPKGYTATASEAVAWLLDWPMRGDAREYLSGHWEEVKRAFLEPAAVDNGYKAGESEKWVSETVEGQKYLAYLETMFTDVVVEFTLGEREAAGMPDYDKFKASVDHPALELTIREAKELRRAFNPLRGTSLDHSQVDFDKLDVFVPTRSGPRAPRALPTTATLPSGGSIDLTKMDPENGADRKALLDALQIATKDAEKIAIRNTLLPYYNTAARIKTLENFRKTAPDALAKERIQYMIDSAAIRFARDISLKLEKIPIANVSTHADTPKMEQDLFDVYAVVRQGNATLDPETTENVADTVSLFLEYIVYQGKHVPPATGKLADYTTYLKKKSADRGVIEQKPTKSTHFNVPYLVGKGDPGAVTRLASNLGGLRGITEGYVKTSRGKRITNWYMLEDDYDMP